MGAGHMIKFANSILVLFLLLLLCFLAEAILKRSEHSDTVVSIFFYYILPSLFIVILIFCLRSNKEYKINIAISLASTGICLLVVDIFFWVSRNNAPSFEELSKKKNIQFDSRTVLEVIESFKKKNVVANPAVYPALFVKQNNMEIYPLSGLSNSLTVYCNESGEYTIYNSDRYGFHNTEKDIWNSGVAEIGVVGDSFLHGACVPTEKNITSTISREYKKTINLGLGGCGPLIELAILKEYMSQLRPKKVLWFYFEANDLIELRSEVRNPTLMRYLKGNYRQNLMDKQSDVDQIWKKYIEKQKFIKQESNKLIEIAGFVKSNLKLSNLRIVINANFNPFFAEKIYTHFQQVISEAKRTTKSWGGELHFVYLPSSSRYKCNKDFHRSKIIEIVERQKVPIIDIYEEFGSVENPLIYFPHEELLCHYNELGYKIVAQKVVERLQAN
jgi:hypothetical protein